MKDSSSCTEWISGDVMSPRFTDYCDGPDYMYGTTDLPFWVNPVPHLARRVVSLFPLSR